jgi:hypothetical protein
MNSFAEILLILTAALLVGAVLYAIFTESWRMLHDDGRLRLRRMLARHGATLNAAATYGFAASETARATRRCVACADKARCDAWLASHRREGFEAFCPNADLIARSAHR